MTTTHPSPIGAKQKVVHEIREQLAEIFDKGWPHLTGMTLVVFVAFLPFLHFEKRIASWAK